MKRAVLAAIIVVCVTGGVSAAMYADGRGQDFSWVNAQDESGLYGQPFSSPSSNEIFFPFMNFNLHYEGPGTTTIADSFAIDLFADDGVWFESVTVVSRGEYFITGLAGENSVEATTVLTAEWLVGDPFVGSDSYDLFDDQPTEGGQPWGDDLLVEIPLVDPDPVTALHVEVSQEFVTVRSSDGDAGITLDTGLFGISIGVPEPSTLALLVLGGLVLGRRR